MTTNSRERAYGRDELQVEVTEWAFRAFGREQTLNVEHRGLRLVEETIEAAQAAGCSKDMLHKLVDYVYSRPVGNIEQELGGVGICLLVLAQAIGISASVAEDTEAARIMSKPIESFSKRNDEKNAAGFIAGKLK